MVQINYDYYEDLTPESLAQLLANLRAGVSVKPGPQVDRSCSEPLGGGLTLKDTALYDGSAVGRGDWQARVTAEREAQAAAARAAEAAKAAAAAAPPAAPTPAPAAPTEKKQAPQQAQAALQPAPAAPTAKPAMLAAARGGKGDDLSLIWGVGPKLAAMLNRMGVWHFDQIASWSEAELAWVDSNFEGFKGRAVRDDWTGQAKKLAAGWRPDNAVGDKPVGKPKGN
jgi:NADH-quinone oxidoreductase subunit E